jgi:penicillin G amidase
VIGTRGPRFGRARRTAKLVNALAALVAAVVVLALLGFGFGTIPALGPALDPARGAWTSAAGGNLPRSQTLELPGLAHPVSVSYTAQGVPSIHAASLPDLSLALGFVQASFRLGEMDLERRVGEGRLAQLGGPGDVASDEFELRLGLLRTARREWAATPRSSPSGQALIAFSRGVNDYLAQVRADGNWPAVFSLPGVYPGPWTPVDSLVIQGVLTQELDFTTTPLDYALLDRSLGEAKTMAWFPVLPPSQQSPYDPGPYRKLGLAPLDTTGSPGPVRASAPVSPAGAAGATGAAGAAGAAAPAVSPAAATAAAALLRQTDALPAGLIHRTPDSNAWAANGPAVAGGGAMLAGDPHLPQTLPSIWYQAALSAPGYAVSGVSIPGLPGILIGHNAHIAWSLTDTQNQGTFFYNERLRQENGDEYYWRGTWRTMRLYHYTIAVRGGAPRHLTVRTTVHGPIMTQAGQTTSVDWMGNVPSPDLAAMLGVSRATDFAQFRAALANWRAPTQNFVYADSSGNIGAISAGYYPQVAHGDPWLPMPGTGADDITGVIPYAAEPQVYDPPGHVLATANQRPVTAAYPYYIGTSDNFFDPGYRANEIYSYLRGHTAMGPPGFAALQTSVTDQLATQIVPRLLAALRSASGTGANGTGANGTGANGTGALTGDERAAERLLAGWNDEMQAGSAAASVWWTFWGDYLSAVFQPWWDSYNVPVHTDRAGLTLSAGQVSLDEDLEAWTLHDPANPAFSPPGTKAGSRTAAGAMRVAFTRAVTHLAHELHGAPGSWAWGRLHRRQFLSLTAPGPLGYGPRAAGGDGWTVDAADGGMTASAGPSWRMIVRWNGTGSAGGAGAGGPQAEGIYPGGQSENPASPWYSDLIAGWWDGRYLPMPPAGGYRSGRVEWALRP